MEKDKEIPEMPEGSVVKYMDACLEQIELLLYRMEALARRASADIPEPERERLQNELEHLREEIDKIADRMPEWYVVREEMFPSEE